MRDPKRIAKILKRLEKAWKKQDELRLAQLLAMGMTDKSWYYREDEQFIEAIEEQIKRCINA